MYIYRTNYSPNKLEKQGSQNRFFSKERVTRRLEKNDFVRLILRVYFGPT